LTILFRAAFRVEDGERSHARPSPRLPFLKAAQYMAEFHPSFGPSSNGTVAQPRLVRNLTAMDDAL
jgi:hypothetical protein